MASAGRYSEMPVRRSWSVPIANLPEVSGLRSRRKFVAVRYSEVPTQPSWSVLIASLSESVRTDDPNLQRHWLARYAVVADYDCGCVASRSAAQSFAKFSGRHLPAALLEMHVADSADSGRS